MGVAVNTSTGEIASWHALSANEVVKRLATNREKGLDAAEAARRLRRRAKSFAGGQEAGPVHAVPLPSSTTYSSMFFLAPGSPS